jgi:hypothetical protein
VHEFLAPGTFTVTLHVVDDRGGSASTSVTITITSPPTTGNPIAVRDTLSASMLGLGSIFMLAGIGLAAKLAAKRRQRRRVPGF